MLLLALTLHVQFIGLLSMLKLTPDIVVNNVLVVMNVPARSIDPNCNHEQCPKEKEDEKNRGADKVLFRNIIVG